VVKGGGNETANIEILHATCNLRKGARDSTDDMIRYLQGRIRNI
jgi:5-methylcytosine-specific restriction endonuclease McrA